MHIPTVLFLLSLRIASDNSLFQLMENLLLQYIWSLGLNMGVGKPAVLPKLLTQV